MTTTEPIPEEWGPEPVAPVTEPAPADPDQPASESAPSDAEPDAEPDAALEAAPTSSDVGYIGRHPEVAAPITDDQTPVTQPSQENRP